MMYIHALGAIVVVVLIVLFAASWKKRSLKQFDFDGAKQSEKEKRGPLQ